MKPEPEVIRPDPPLFGGKKNVGRFFLVPFFWRRVGDADFDTQVTEREKVRPVSVAAEMNRGCQMVYLY
jgi:hypothetical protein